MIKIRIADESDRQQWDDYVRRHTEASPYQLMAWTIAIEAAYNHRQFNLIAERHGEIVGVLPLCLMTPPLARGTLCSMPFCDLGGCLCDDPEIRGKIMEAALKIADEYSVSSLEIRGRLSYSEVGDRNYPGKVSMLLRLPESAELLFAGFKAKLRSQIRKAEKNGLTFRVGRGTEDLDDFYRVLSVKMRDLGSPVHSMKWFDSVRAQYEDDMTIGIVSKNDVPVGAGILLFLEDKAVIPWASTCSKYNHLAPNMMLYWNLLKFATDKHCTIFDFGRSTFGEGTYKFKQQWGAVPVPLDWQYYFVGGEASEVKVGSQRLRKGFERVWRHLPLQITNRLGPHIRKYISL